MLFSLAGFTVLRCPSTHQRWRCGVVHVTTAECTGDTSKPVVEGFDIVAYRSLQPGTHGIRGSKEFSAQYGQGYTFLFSTLENKLEFEVGLSSSQGVVIGVERCVNREGLRPRAIVPARLFCTTVFWRKIAKTRNGFHAKQKNVKCGAFFFLDQQHKYGSTAAGTPRGNLFEMDVRTWHSFPAFQSCWKWPTP